MGCFLQLGPVTWAEIAQPSTSTACSLGGSWTIELADEKQ